MRLPLAHLLCFPNSQLTPPPTFPPAPALSVELSRLPAFPPTPTQSSASAACSMALPACTSRTSVVGSPRAGESSSCSGAAATSLSDDRCPTALLRITPDQASELKAVPATVSVHRAVSSEAGVSSTDGDPTQVSPTHLPPSFSQPTATLSSISPEASFPLPSPLATVLQQERPGPSVAQQQVPSIPAQHPLPPRIAPIQEEVVEYHASSREDTPDEEEEDNEGGRGSTFTFLNEQRNNVQHDVQRSPGQGQSVPARAYSMRALLRPVASIPSNYLPDVPSSFFASDEADDERVDPIKLGLVPEEFAQELFDFFIKQQNRWCGILEPEFDTYGMFFFVFLKTLP